jgi:aldose 1-epimerase
MLITSLCAAASVFGATAFAQYSPPPEDRPIHSNNTFEPNANGKYEISSEGIRALFIPYGASITDLFIKDINGIERDIVLGFDNASHYSVDPFHPHLGGVPGMIWDMRARRMCWADVE